MGRAAGGRLAPFRSRLARRSLSESKRRGGVGRSRSLPALSAFRCRRCPPQWALGDGLGLSNGLARRVASEFGLGFAVGLPAGPNPELSGVSVTP